MSNNSTKPPKKPPQSIPVLSSPPLEPLPNASTSSYTKQIPNLSKCEFNAPKPHPTQQIVDDAPPPLSSTTDRFKDVKLPNGWLHCPLEFTQPLRDYRILVCKTPIDTEIAHYLKIPKDKYFAPHNIYTLPNRHYQHRQQQLSPDMTPKKRKVGLVIDLTNQTYYDEISFNSGRKPNKVMRRVITMQNALTPTEGETSGFVGLVKSFLDSANNQDKWIVVHDDLGYNLSGFMCAAFMVKELNYSVDAAVHTFAQSRKPGIYDAKYIRLLHEMFSDEEDQQIFEQVLKLKPLFKPSWMRQSNRMAGNRNKMSKHKTSGGFAVPTTSIRRKRSFSEMSKATVGQLQGNNHNNNNTSSLIEEPSLLSEPTLIQTTAHSPSSSSSNIIMEPTLIAPVEQAFKKHKPQAVHVPKELKREHSYLVAVGGQHLQHLTAIALQLSKNKALFGSIQCKPATIPRGSLMALRNGYRISWLGDGHVFWLMILGRKGCFFVDPSYLETGKLGGIYHIGGTQFYNEKNRQYLDGTLCCGELVVDHTANKKVSRFLITDLLVIDKQSLSKFPHTERLMRAEDHLYKPFAKSLQSSKLRIRVKPMYRIESEEIIDKLQRMIDTELPHKCRGLGLFPIKAPFGQRLLRIIL